MIHQNRNIAKPCNYDMYPGSYFYLIHIVLFHFDIMKGRNRITQNIMENKRKRKVKIEDAKAPSCV